MRVSSFKKHRGVFVTGRLDRLSHYKTGDAKHIIRTEIRSFDLALELVAESARQKARKAQPKKTQYVDITVAAII